MLQSGTTCKWMSQLVPCLPLLKMAVQCKHLHYFSYSSGAVQCKRRHYFSYSSGAAFFGAALVHHVLGVTLTCIGPCKWSFTLQGKNICGVGGGIGSHFTAAQSKQA